MSQNLEEILQDFKRVKQAIDLLLWIAAIGFILSIGSLIRQSYDASMKSNTPTITPTPTMTPTPIQTATWQAMTAEVQTPQR